MIAARKEDTLPKGVALSDPALLKSFAYIASRWTAAADASSAVFESAIHFGAPVLPEVPKSTCPRNSGKGGNFVMKVDGQNVGEARIDATVAARFGVDTFGIGEDSGQPVTFDYAPPFKFSDRIDGVTIDRVVP